MMFPGILLHPDRVQRRLEANGAGLQPGKEARLGEGAGAWQGELN